MSIVEDIVVPIAVASGIGAAIDFYLGSSGQKRVKNWLEERWYRFHEVNWHNFSEKEAHYYLTIADRIFGPTLFSRKRWAVCLAISGMNITILWIVVLVNGYPVTFFNETSVLDYLVSTLAFAISISATQWLSLRIVAGPLSQLRGARLFPFFLMLHYALLVLWRPLADFVIINMKMLVTICALLWRGTNESIGELGPELFVLGNPFADAPVAPLDLIRDITAQLSFPDDGDGSVYVDFANQAVLSIIANSFRLLVALMLFLAFLFRVCLGPIFSTTWARLVESDKPVFTIVFGAMGAIATSVKEIAKL
jgi:hypothetical protein